MEMEEHAKVVNIAPVRKAVSLLANFNVIFGVGLFSQGFGTRKTQEGPVVEIAGFYYLVNVHLKRTLILRLLQSQKQLDYFSPVLCVKWISFPAVVVVVTVAVLFLLLLITMFLLPSILCSKLVKMVLNLRT